MKLDTLSRLLIYPFAVATHWNSPLCKNYMLMSYDTFQNGVKKHPYVYLQTHMILLPVSQADRREIRQGMSVQSSGLDGWNPRIVNLLYTPVLVTALADLWGTYGHEEAHTCCLLHRTPHLTASSARLKWEETMTLPTKSETRERDNLGEGSTASTGAPPGWALCPSSYASPSAMLISQEQHKHRSAAPRPELPLLSAPLEHQRGDFATVISSEFPWKMSRTIQGSAELFCSQKEHFLKKAPGRLNIQLLKCLSRCWNIKAIILAVFPNIHSNKTSLFIYYRPISRNRHMS